MNEIKCNVSNCVYHEGNHLHRGAQVFALPLLVEHIPVDLAGGEVGVFVQVLVDEALHTMRCT